MANLLLRNAALVIMLLPLLGAIIAGLFGKNIGRKATHTITITLVGISFLLSCYVFNVVVLYRLPAIDAPIYEWVSSGLFHFNVGILIDRLSAIMMVIVTFISFMVHIYTIGYMSDDPGYQRFFSYMSLFTFAMLSLVLADNFLVLFFGWEGVGLVSYLLIGFWFKREAAVFGGLKAFLANRVGDIGFLLGTAAILTFFNSLNYNDVFSNVSTIIGKNIFVLPNISFSAITVICVLLFIGAMGKSAQMPLHVWLPESMEGPTPISALIHAATMVTAGIYMVARMSPLFEYSDAALSFVLVMGATTCFFTGLLAVFQYDIKRVIAYSTLSQLGYMTVALGVSAYDASIFHLMTHAFFKALLFLAAGSVIIAMHHEQDMRKMGGLALVMPVTYVTFLMGALALSAIPPFAGFYSKDAIIEAVQFSTIKGANYAYFCVLAGAFITPLYIFRALFLTFHGKSKIDAHVDVRESRWVILIPLILLAIPSLIIGGMFIGPMLFSKPNLLGNSILILPIHSAMQQLAEHYEGAKKMALEAGKHLTLWLAIAGIVTAWIFNSAWPAFAENLKKHFAFFYSVMIRKYGFDDFNQIIFVRGFRRLGEFLYDIGDLKFIDGYIVNGCAKLIQWFARVSRHVQTGFIYHYALAMVLGLAIFLSWTLLGR